MPSCPSSQSEIDFALDVQALRHLVTRRQIADVLWSGDCRTALEEALREIHGDKSFLDLEHIVSTQRLLTHIKLLPSLLEHLFDENNDRRARHVRSIVRDIIQAYREDSESIQFQQEFVLMLLQALLQASLQILMKANLDDIRATYRTTIDLIRDMFQSFEDSQEAHELKKIGIKLVKGLTAVLARSDRRSALLKARKFLRNYSNKTTARCLQDQSEILEKELGPLVIRRYYVTSATRTEDVVRWRQRGNNTSHVPEEKPDFFSDRSDETSNITPDYDSPGDDARNIRPRLVKTNIGSEMSSPSSMETPIPPKKRARMSREVVDHELNDVVGVLNGDMPTRSETPVSKSRGRRYPRIGQELNGMNSPMFSETRPAPESVDHVVRHARSRGHNKIWRPKEGKKRHPDRDRSPDSISQEGASPAHRGKRVREPDEPSDEGRHVGNGMDRSDEDVMGRMGREGEVIHDLHAKAKKLQASGPSDPLPDAIRDARRARRRRYESDPSYIPGDNARDASPFPDSDDESDLPRKKVSRLRLTETPIGHRTKRQGQRPPVVRPAMYIFGKPCRTGRFESFEDALLLKGLQALGWGAWTEIAREFWEGEFTRAPGSLKDRARTLGLCPQEYPRRMELRGRPRLPDNPANSTGPSLQGPRGKSGHLIEDDTDADEDEADPIEAPDGTPESGEQQKEIQGEEQEGQEAGKGEAGEEGEGTLRPI